MPFAEVNNQRIRFDDSGGDGPAVILSHGFLMDREMFAPQIDALAGEFRVIAWDERGFGRPSLTESRSPTGTRPRTAWACWTTWPSTARCLAVCRRAAFYRCARLCWPPSGSARSC